MEDLAGAIIGVFIWAFLIGIAIGFPIFIILRAIRAGWGC